MISLKKIITNLLKKFNQNQKIEDIIKLNFGQIKLQLFKQNYKNSSPINSYEFKSFSQFGEDGIIQYLINNINIKNKFFVEFGVENYDEANTRFLLENDNWSGLLIEADKEKVEEIKKDFYWKYNINVMNEFITKENINQILNKSQITKEIGLLSIDIDGNDYWIWNEINVIDPAIVVIEYNSRFGPKKNVTIPYDKNFSRSSSKYPNIYFGASLVALSNLARKKNYSLVGTNRNGNNAFFVKTDLLILNNNIKEKQPHECYHENSFSEMRDEQNNIIKYSKQEEKEILNKLPLHNFDQK